MTASRYPAAEGALRVTRTADPPGLAVAGDIDESSYDELVAALATTADWPEGEVHIDMAGVTYCDLAGLRAIIGVTAGSGGVATGPADSGGPPAAQGAGTPGQECPGGERRTVILHSVPAELKAVLRILAWDSVPGLVITEGNGGSAGRGARGDGGRAGGSEAR
jgi:STAS domain